jgi:hypothetical protein
MNDADITGFVIPAEAGIHFDFRANAKWVPAFAGTTKTTTSA